MQIKKVVTSFNKLYDAALDDSHEEPILVDKLDNLYPSSFPFCGLRYMYDRLQDGGDPTERMVDLRQAFYTSVGTIVHEVIQDFLGKVPLGEGYGEIWGNWEFDGDNSEGGCNFTPYSKIENQEKDWKYAELRMQDFLRTRGRLDGLYKFEGKWYVLDYKTTSSYKVQQHNSGVKPCFPYYGNKAQLEAYGVVLERKFDIKISGWLLIYISRDNPSNRSVVGEELSDVRKRKLKARLQKWDKNFDLSRKLLTSGKKIHLKQLHPIYEGKLCKDYAYYKKYVHTFYDECPLSKTCFDAQAIKPVLEKAVGTYNDAKK